MKMIMAYIQPYKLEEVRDALEKAGAHGVTATEVKGHGRQRGHTEFYRGAEYKVSFASKVKLEIAVEDRLVDAVVQAIEDTAKSGHIGDGKIFVLPLDNAVKVRTGEAGDAAL
ncbi:MAG: P-II family nitrogen regulator [Aestuariivirga sp.]|jgi:nitrogen regulatory protein P-II 2|nr:P-II family nitrogen regulator [Aestuariivirga sp.]